MRVLLVTVLPASLVRGQLQDQRAPRQQGWTAPCLCLITVSTGEGEKGTTAILRVYASDRAVIAQSRIQFIL